jgi:hypothetical protein
MKAFFKTILFSMALISLAVVAQNIELPYESVFKDYQAHKEVKLLDWKASNEGVRAAGGWRAYQRESQAPDVPTPAKAESMMQDKPAANPHQGHGK